MNDPTGSTGDTGSNPFDTVGAIRGTYGDLIDETAPLEPDGYRVSPFATPEEWKIIERACHVQFHEIRRLRTEVAEVDARLRCAGLVPEARDELHATSEALHSRIPPLLHTVHHLRRLARAVDITQARLARAQAEAEAGSFRPHR